LFIGGIATSGVKKWTKPLEKVTEVTFEDLKKICSDYFVDLPKKIKDDMKGKNVFRKY
jgi:protein-disulfide isomerase